MSHGIGIDEWNELIEQNGIDRMNFTGERWRGGKSFSSSPPFTTLDSI